MAKKPTPKAVPEADPTVLVISDGDVYLYDPQGLYIPEKIDRRHIASTKDDLAQSALSKAFKASLKQKRSAAKFFSLGIKQNRSANKSFAGFRKLDKLLDEHSLKTAIRGVPVMRVSSTVEQPVMDELIDRATEVLGTRDEAMRWLGTPVAALNFATPISILGTEEGIERVSDVLGQMEYGIW